MGRKYRFNPQPGRSPGARNRNGVPALLAFRSVDRGRKHSVVARQGRTDYHNRREGQILSESYGLPLDPYSMVGDLSVGERQRIEIIRCLLQKPELIILDEPTSVLTPQEADKLFETLERLRDEGKSILYISHRLEEVKRMCAAATVLRHGRVVNHCDPKKETAASLANMMVGEEVTNAARTPSGGTGEGEILIEVKDLARPPATPFSIPLRGVSLNVRAGEVIGVAGVAGNGQGSSLKRFRERSCNPMRRRCAFAVRTPAA